MNYLEYFMWGYQTHYWISVNSAAEEIFKKLDESLIPNVFLVGILQEGIEGKHAACVEPEECIHRPAIFKNAMYLSKTFEKSDPDQQLFHSHPIAQERHTKNIKLKAISNSIIHQLKMKQYNEGKTFFSSIPVLVNDYWVSVVVEFSSNALNSYYSLGNSTKNSYYKLHTSLVEATIYEYLTQCAKA
jgi:hypothetical protein